MEPIAVIGFSVKLPGGISDETGYWEAIEKRQNSIRKIPDSRIAVDDQRELTSKFPVTCAHLLEEELGAFDAPFFSMTASDAAAMDPQHRWALESTFLAFENAGIGMETVSGSQTAVFASSISSSDYEYGATLDGQSLPRSVISGTSQCMLANRVSWYYNLLGPSAFVDTGCSGSLVGLDMACKSIYSGDATMALVLGANLLLRPASFIKLSNMGFLSPDGICYSFDSRGNGYGRSEGILALVIQPLSAAIADGNSIRALIRSTGSNQDGHTPGIHMPSVQAQEALIRHVYRRACLDLKVTRYFEAHGTGTPTGDPIETSVIGRVFGPCRSTESPIYVGSVKANTGHLEGGSGLAGIIKTVLALEKGKIPPVGLFEEVNPAIDLDSSHIEIPTEVMPWPDDGLRRASVSSFGFGGTNSHAVLDDACHYLHACGLSGHHRCSLPPQPLPVDGVSAHATVGEGGGESSHNPNPGDGGALDDDGKRGEYPTLLVWSASNRKSLDRVVGSYRESFETLIQGSTTNLSHLAHTLGTRRSRLDWRTFTIVHSPSIVPACAEPVRASSSPGSVFVLTGQGAQYARMGAGLLRYSAFRRGLQEMDDIYRRLGCEWSIFDELCDEQHIHSPEYSQPICTALQIALLDLLAEFNMQPRAVVGHSSGEIAASYAAGALSKESAGRVAYFRGQVAGKLKATTATPGAMLAVAMSDTDAADYLTPHVSVACINSPRSCTISGPEEAVDALKRNLAEQGIRTRKLVTGVAYHSSAMRQVADEYLESMGTLLEPGHGRGAAEAEAAAAPRFFSSVTGAESGIGSLCEPRYWVENLVRPVRFSDALLSLLTCLTEHDGDGAEPITDLVEIGPHSALQVPVEETLAVAGLRPQPRYWSVLRRDRCARETVLGLVGSLWSYGHALSVSAGNGQAHDAFPPLPGCPPYPFDHATSYWSESRLSRASRHLRYSDYGLLGRPSSDWNPLQPRWRQFLTLERFPWLSDHVTDGLTTFPGSGSLILAIQAVRQYVLPGDSVTGLWIQEARFISPIVIDEAKGKTEVVTQLFPPRESDGDKSGWFRVQIHSHHDGHWTECFEARVQVQCAGTSSTDMDGGQERVHDRQRMLHRHQSVVASCTRPLDTGEFYDAVRESGVAYGKAFRLLSGLSWDGAGASSAVVAAVRGSDSRADSRHCTADDLFHPTSLDAASQLCYASLSRGMTRQMPMWIPSQMRNCWVSAQPWRGGALHVSCASTEVDRSASNSSRTEKRSIRVMSSDGEPLWEVGELVLTATTTASAHQQGMDKMVPMHRIRWRPQLSLMSWHELLQTCPLAAVPLANESALAELHRLYDAAFSLTLRRELLRRNGDPVQLPEYFRKYHASALPHLSDDFVDDYGYEESEIETILTLCEDRQPGSRLVTSVVRNLGPILDAQVDPLEVFFHSSHDIETLYRDVLDNERFSSTIGSFLDLLSHERPGLRILEVGAGTGSMTTMILGLLSELERRDGPFKLRSYTFTDISPQFFEKARVRFRDFEDRMVFQVLDLEKPIEEQGLRSGSYDVVVACNVIHATSDVAATLANIRRALAPRGGYLVNLDAVQPDRFWFNMMWGLLPGWWLAKEEFRTRSPLIDRHRWRALLDKTGYQGIGLAVRDHEADDAHIWSLMISAAAGETGGDDAPTTTSRFGRVAILVDPCVEEQRQLACALLQYAKGAVVVPIQDAVLLVHADTVVSLVEVGRPFIATANETTFVRLQEVIMSVQKLLWVARADLGHLGGVGTFSLEGFFRSMRLEHPDKRFVTLVLGEGPENPPCPEACLGHITRVLEVAFAAAAGGDLPGEVEYVVRGGLLTTARLAAEPRVQTQVRRLVHPASVTEPWLPGSAVRLDIRVPGDLETLHLVDDDDPSCHGQLGADEIEVEARAWSVNFRDVLVALQKMDSADGLGLDCAGLVTRVGTNCGDRLQPGDRVVAVGLGLVRTYPRSHFMTVQKLPDSCSFEDAVSMTNPAATAIYCLLHTARLQRGEKILIHSGAGSTGQMAIRLAQSIGADIYVTVGREEKRQFLVDELGIARDRIFFSRDPSFARAIMRVTQGRGVDVLLNSLPGESLVAGWECMAPFGRFIEIGKRDIMNNSSLPMASFRGNTSFHAVDLVHLMEHTQGRELMQSLMGSALDLLLRGTLKPPKPTAVYGIGEAESAYRHVQSGKHAGRAVLSINPSDMVTKTIREPHKYRFDPAASYLIVGGLGGIGASLAAWMADMGARYLILLSRTGISSPAKRRLVHQLRCRDVTVVTPTCDAADDDELRRTLEQCGRTMPAIRGSINAAMVLENVSFEDMDFPSWNAVIRSKVASSWNLHNQLSRDLDFFILLSSIIGTQGAVAQSNYAAACTFQDGLARRRVAQGQKAVSLCLGWMRSVGAVSESRTMARVVKSLGIFEPIEEEELLATLYHCCDPCRPVGDESDALLILGARTEADLVAIGKNPPANIKSPMFSSVAQTAAGPGKGAGCSSARQGEEVGDGQASIGLLLQRITSPIERRELIVDEIAGKLARSLAVSRGDIDDTKTLTDYGIDSLVAVEMRNWISNTLHATVVVFELLGNVTIRALGSLILERTSLTGGGKEEEK